MTFKAKLRAYAWFILLNSFLSVLISTRYFAYLPELPTEFIAQLFLMSGTFSQMALLSAIMGLIALPLLLLPEKPMRFVLSLVSSLGLGVLIIDTLVFAQYRFHLNMAVLEMIFSGQIVSFPLVTWLSVIGGALLVFFLEYRLILLLTKEPRFIFQGWGRRLSLTLFLALLITNGIHIWAAANAFQPVTMLKRYLPLFYPATANSFMRKRGWLDEEAIARQKQMSLERESDLNYPLKALDLEVVDKPINIVFILVDSWRADTFNQDNTPHLWDFAQQGVVLNNHMATGNATRMGIFGLFYSLPGTYWHSFLANTRTPLFMDRLQALDYQIGVFASAHLRSPEFDQTVFAGIVSLRTESSGNSVADRDINVTDDWLQWYANRDQQRPSFSFLFYDAPHAYDFPDGYPHRYEPMLSEVNYLAFDNETDPTPFFNRYRTSVHFVDEQIKRVLDKLESEGELANTLVLITGDHGQEMNDNKLNYWGHNSNFTAPQIHVPFIIAGPKVVALSSLSEGRLTSHYDVAPTLMRNYLGVTSPINDYAVGQDLYANPDLRDWLLVAKYSGYAVVSDTQILEVGATGQYELMDKTNRELKNQSPNFEHLQHALEQISRFRK